MAAFWFVLVVAAAWLVWKASSQRNDSPRASPKRASQRAAAQSENFAWPSLGRFDFEVVGESHCQDALRRFAGDHGTASAETQCVAELHLDSLNAHDKSAVEVRVQGERVGFLSRNNARSFRRRLGAKKLGGQRTYCDAMIVGGWTDHGGEKKHYGIRLDMKPFDD